MRDKSETPRACMAMNKARRRVRGDALAQCGRGAVTGFAILLLTGESQAQQPPRELREKSIVLNWSETRSVKILTGRHAGQDDTYRFDVAINLYVSAQGRVFSTLKRVAGRYVFDDSNQVSGTGENLLVWRFQDGALDADMAFAQGARRLAVTFSNQFNACSVNFIYGKEGGTAPIIWEAPNGERTEVIDIKLLSTSCSVQQGNIFDKPQ
jgi:hypothetical protein